MFSRREFLVFALATPSASWFGPKDPNFEGDATFMRILQKALDARWHDLPIGELMGKIATELLGTPYVGWTLENDVDREFCYVSMDRLDCVTFFETTLGFARALQMWKHVVESKAAPNVRLRRPLPSDVIDQVTFTRYRGGKVDGYLSRLHYTSDWIHDNAKKGVVRNLTGQLSGGAFEKKVIDFMSKNAHVYRQLKAHPELIPKLKRQEAELTKRNMPFVPKSQAASVSNRLRTGDIIGLTTTMDGMDCSHTGLIVVEKGVARFMHASSTQKKVVLDGPLAQIVEKSTSYTGFMVARPLNWTSIQP